MHSKNILTLFSPFKKAHEAHIHEFQCCWFGEKREKREKNYSCIYVEATFFFLLALSCLVLLACFQLQTTHVFLGCCEKSEKRRLREKKTRKCNIYVFDTQKMSWRTINQEFSTSSCRSSCHMYTHRRLVEKCFQLSHRWQMREISILMLPRRKNNSRNCYTMNA